MASMQCNTYIHTHDTQDTKCFIKRVAKFTVHENDEYTLMMFKRIGLQYNKISFRVLHRYVYTLLKDRSNWEGYYSI